MLVEEIYVNIKTEQALVDKINCANEESGYSGSDLAALHAWNTLVYGYDEITDQNLRDYLNIMQSKGARFNIDAAVEFALTLDSESDEI